ncbi:uncharacterized protein PV06_09321 [Exophiala oligosperma]|uniref:Ribosomal RNA-processing protein 43 n=1 Tax=Exophiala oligosperma TaxID=215243 RepID=A0A0D2DRI6_9EURO|nr:uncharacterized protein PV06_09321 [Exophiala oligosperma]KIW38349.1 hypothetical protein PV06_09321 [Exophiala oligosperma]
MPSATLPPSSLASIPPSAMPLISPNALLHAHLKQNPPKRPSNRAPSEPRPVQLNVGSLAHCNGSSLIKIGVTTIVCGVRAEILPVSEIPNFRVTKTSSSYTPSASAVQDGHFQDKGQEEEYSAIRLYNLVVPNIELGTGCSPKHPANAPPSVEAQSISQRLLSTMYSSKLVRTTDLEILYTPPTETQDIELGITGDPQLKAYWTLYIDMMCISHGGSIFDAAWLAMHAALKDVKLPKAWWDPDWERILCSADIGDARRLNLRGMPVSSSFGVFLPEERLLNANDTDDEHWILMDMDSFEEEACEETGAVIVDASGKGKALSIVRIEKNGGSAINVEHLTKIVGFAERRWNQWKDVLDSTLVDT